MRDEQYILDLCDTVLQQKSIRQHRFSFLVGDSGVCLPVDAFYPELKLVIEYCERQHSESIAFFDKKVTVSGVSRGEQRARYDQRRRDMIPKNDLTLVELCYSEFLHDSRKRLKRVRDQDLIIVQARLHDFAVQQPKRDGSNFDFSEMSEV